MAKRHPKSILIDGRSELASASPRKLLDDHVIADTHHPTLRGCVALADAVLRELDRKNVFGSALSDRGGLDPAVCATHFGMDAERWATMCERASVHYRRVAGYRYDGAERLEKSRRYAEAAKKIRSGVYPTRWDCRASGSSRHARGRGLAARKSIARVPVWAAGLRQTASPMRPMRSYQGHSATRSTCQS